MHVSVTFRHMDTSDALKAYAEEKSERLARFLTEPVEIHWMLSVEKIRHIADATITSGGATINAKEHTQDMYSAIDMVMDKLEKQVRKHKEKVKDHKAHGNVEATSIRYTPSEAASPESSAGSPRIVKKENQFVKPMSVEEAAMQMDVVGNDFLVFTDSVTNNISVIYRLGNGDYGLIEAQTK